MNKNILIIGASVRAHVQSAIRSGFHVEAYDLFADYDCQLALKEGGTQKGTVAKIDSFEQIADLIRTRKNHSQLPAPDVALLCGGSELQPRVVSAIVAWLPVAGCCPDSVTRLTDWDQLPDVIRSSGCQVAETTTRLDPDSSATDWLRKPVQGRGGMQIRVATDSDFEEVISPKDHIFQRRISGDSWSALFSAKKSRTALIGITKQLVGDPRFTDSPFAYCGSIGPVRLTVNHEAVVTRLGEQLVHTFNLSGVFGVDFIVNDDGVWPVDFNPRITASAEIFERFDRVTEQSRAFNMIEHHLGLVDLQTCSHDKVHPVNQRIGKAILFNQTNRSLLITRDIFNWLVAFEGSHSRVADIPNAGETIQPGDPIATILTTKPDAKKVESELARMAQLVRARLTS
jgi:predicted ATP-grasp superfamily ATP-dependent carboligase